MASPKEIVTDPRYAAKEEIAWLIELKGTFGPYCWWAGSGNGEIQLEWTIDPNKVIRFARQQDAEQAISAIWGEPELNFTPIATEHIWL